jgi:hypothetical protein
LLIGTSEAPRSAADRHGSLTHQWRHRAAHQAGPDTGRVSGID